MAEYKFVVLACEGGGIRGVISSMLLQGLGQPVLDRVDFYTGTSTGSIIALGLAAGLPIGQIVELYGSAQNCSTIFRPYLSLPARAAEHAVVAGLEATVGRIASDAGHGGFLDALLRDVSELFFPKHASSGVRELLEANLSDVTLVGLLAERSKYVAAPSLQIDAERHGKRQWKPRLFTNLPGRDFDLSGTKLIDVAMSSAAAPLYFPPHTLTLPDGSTGTFVDGGMFANNPGGLAIAALVGSGVLEQRELTLDDVVMVSVGTGDVANSYPPPDELFPYGMLGWLRPEANDGAPAFPLIDAIMDGTAEAGDAMAKLLLRAGNYFRLDVPLEQSVSLDDCAVIGTLTSATQAYMTTPAWEQKRGAILQAVGAS